MSARIWRRARQGVQVLALLLFLGLFVYTNAQRPQLFWADLFVRLDPLLMLAASLAGQTLVSGLWLAGLVLALTLLFGRVWCGWLCPLGTLLEWTGSRRAGRRAGRRAPASRWRALKYLLLLAVVVAALLGNQVLTFLDPITILNRTLATAVWPALRFLTFQTSAFLYHFPALWPALDAAHAAVLQPVFLDVQPAFSLALLTTLLFVTLVALNLWAERFWCRYLCPLGGLLALLSKLSLLRRQVSGACAQCARCTHDCPTGTIDPQAGYRSDPAECIVCFDCLVDCSRQGIGFRWQFPAWRPAPWRPAPWQAYDPRRREALAVLGLTMAGVALAGVDPAARRTPARVLRPPGASGPEFGALCVRCGACLRVCPTQGLQPSLLEAGLPNLLTPRLLPRRGYCSFACHACGQVCPTGAIPNLALADKQSTPIGLASIDPGRCLPWAYDTPCIVCEEVCPIADKAIVLDEVEVPDAGGGTWLLQRPRVLRELCIGCGICEYHCPMPGASAIQVHAPLALDSLAGPIFGTQDPAGQAHHGLPLPPPAGQREQL
jgi:polyferredoxin/Pyruvate/2-oxoacid:ferredoxin oxidoreductase delta subunit